MSISTANVAGGRFSRDRSAGVAQPATATTVRGGRPRPFPQRPRVGAVFGGKQFDRQPVRQARRERPAALRQHGQLDAQFPPPGV